MRKVVAVIFILFFVIPLLTASLVLFSMRTWVFDRNFYLDALNGEKLVSLLGNSDLFKILIKNSGANDALAIAASAALKTVVTPEYLENQWTGIIDQLLNFFQGSSKSLIFQIDLTPIKKAINDEKKEEFLDALINNLPSCTTGNYARFPQFNFEYCLSPSESATDLKREISEEILPQLLTLSPDTVNITSVDITPFLKWTSLLGNPSIERIFYLVLGGLFILTIILWLVGSFLADRRWRTRLQWLGGELIIPAIITLALGFLIQTSFLINWASTHLHQVQDSPLGPGIINLIANIVQSLSNRIGLTFLIVGAIALGLASGLIAWGIFTKT